MFSDYQESCLKPCTDVEYSVTTTKHDTQLAVLPFMTGCPLGQTFAEIVFRRKMEIETVRKSYNIVSIFKFHYQEKFVLDIIGVFIGLGGFLGLWLGWSLLATGDLLTSLYRTVRDIK